MRFWDSLLEVLFPSSCLICDAGLPGGSVCCEKCKNAIPLHTTLFCGACRARLPEGKKICHAAFPYLLGAATEYREDAAQTLIRALKFDGVRNAAEPLGALLSKYLACIPVVTENACLVPLPLGAGRLRVRGFNQADLIARVVSQVSGIPIVHALTRVRETKAQSELRELSERKENVANCFALTTPDLVRGKTILLIDDVATSGATLYAAAAAAKEGAPRRIIGLAVAKA